MPTLFASRIHIGLHRKSQQDVVLVNPSLGLFAVADGMGGHAFGGESAALATEVLGGAVFRNHPLEMGFRLADRAIIKQWKGLDLRRPPGTTLTAVLADPGGSAQWASVGDSRLYRWFSGNLEQISVDDTMEGLRPGQDIDPYWKGQLLQALGGNYGDQLEVHGGQIEFGPGTVLLLCSDGLNKMVPDAGIAEILGHVAGGSPSQEKLEEAAEALQAATLKAGGVDNIAVVLVARV